MKDIRVAVIGGSGFLGQHIVRELQTWQHRQLQEENQTNPGSIYEKKIDFSIKEILVLDVKPFTPDVEIKAKPPVAYTYCDIRNDNISQHLKDVTVVFHCAAILPGILKSDKGIDPSDVYKVNYEGTKHIIEACQDCGVEALISTSSMGAVMGGQKIIDHTEPLTPEVPQSQLIMGDYGRMRKKMESIVLNANGIEGKKGIKLQTTVIRPVWLYGEGDKHLIPYFADLARKNEGILPQIGGRFTVQQMTYAGNAAYAHICAMFSLLQPQNASLRKVGGLMVYVSDDSSVGHANTILNPFLQGLKLKAVEGLFSFPVIFLVTFILNFLNTCGLHSIKLSKYLNIMIQFWSKSLDFSSIPALLMTAMSKIFQMKNNEKSIFQTFGKKSSELDINIELMDVEHKIWPKKNGKNYEGIFASMPLIVQKMSRSSLFINRMRAELYMYYNPIYSWKESYDQSMKYYKKYMQ